MSKSSDANSKRYNIFVSNAFSMLNIIVILVILFAGFAYLLFLKRDTVSP